MLKSLTLLFQDQGIWTCSAKNKHGVSQTKCNVLAQVRLSLSVLVFLCISSVFLCISSVFLCISSVFLLHGVSQTKCNVLAQVRLSLLILCKVKFITLARVSTTKKNFFCLARVCTAKKDFLLMGFAGVTCPTRLSEEYSIVMCYLCKTLPYNTDFCLLGFSLRHLLKL